MWRIRIMSPAILSLRLAYQVMVDLTRIIKDAVLDDSWYLALEACNGGLEESTEPLHQSLRIVYIDQNPLPAEIFAHQQPGSNEQHFINDPGHCETVSNHHSVGKRGLCVTLFCLITLALTLKGSPNSSLHLDSEKPGWYVAAALYHKSEPLYYGTSESRHLVYQTERTAGGIMAGCFYSITKGKPMIGGRVLMLSAEAAYAGFFSPFFRRRYMTLSYKFFFVTSTSEIPMLAGDKGELDLGGRFTREMEDSLQIPLYGGPNEGYCAMIAIGRVQVQEFCVLVDTGSSNLAIAATAHADITEYYNTSSVDASFHDLGVGVSVSYTGGEWSGKLATDVVSFVDSNGDRVETTEASIALIQSSKDFFIKGAEWEGIMGLAYPKLAKPDSSVEPYWDSLRRARGMSDVFSLQFCPPIDQPDSTKTQEQGGQLVLGSPSDLYSGSMFYTSIVGDDFYRVLITNMSVGGVAVDVSCKEFNTDRTIVDSGTTDIYLPTKVFQAVLAAFLEYFKSFPNFDIPETFWTGDSKLAWTSSNLHFVFSNFPTVYIAFAAHDNEAEEFSLGVTSQIYLRQVEGSVEEQNNPVCHPLCDFFVFGIKQRETGTVIGGNIMLGFTTVFDREEGRIGFAESTCQYQDQSMETIPHIVGLYPRDVVDCRCTCVNITQIAIILTALAALCVLVSIVLTFFLYMHKGKKKARRSSAIAPHPCCYGACKKPQPSVEEEGSGNNENSETSASQQPDSPAAGSLNVAERVSGKQNAFGAAVSWFKYQGSSFVWSLKSRVLRRSKVSTISQYEDVESVGTREELTDLTKSAAIIGDDNDVESQMQPELRAIAQTRSFTADSFETTSDDLTASGDQNLTSSVEQHKLVVGKSSYIDDTYPKLATALSDSPQNSLTAEFVCNATRQSYVPEAAACDVQACRHEELVLQCNPAQAHEAVHSLSPSESDSESERPASSNEKDKLVVNSPASCTSDVQDLLQKAQSRVKSNNKKKRKNKEEHSVITTAAAVVTSREVYETSFMITNDEEYQNLLNNNQLQHDELLNSAHTQSDSNTSIYGE